MLVSSAQYSSRVDKKSGSYENFRYLFHVSRLNLVVRLTTKYNSLTAANGTRIAAKKEKGGDIGCREEQQKKHRTKD
jgi:hypothetical protein